MLRNVTINCSGGTRLCFDDDSVRSASHNKQTLSRSGVLIGGRCSEKEHALAEMLSEPHRVCTKSLTTVEVMSYLYLLPTIESGESGSAG
jgi:hypothetical protein